MKTQFWLWMTPVSENIKLGNKSYQLKTEVVKKKQKVECIRVAITITLLILSFVLYEITGSEIGYGWIATGTILLIHLVFLVVYIYLFPKEMDDVINKMNE